MRNRVLCAVCLLFAVPLLFADSNGDGLTGRSNSVADSEISYTAAAERAVRTIKQHGGRVRGDESDPDVRPVTFVASDGSFTDAGLIGVGALKEVRMIHLAFSQVTDVGLIELKGFSDLQHLDLCYTQVTDRGMKQLRLNGLQSLRALRVECTEVTDTGVKDIVTLRNLRGIDLAKTKITDAGLKDLATLPQLQGLDLHDTKITDVGLNALSNVKSLELVRITGTGVTQAGVVAFKKALPNCRLDIRGLWLNPAPTVHALP